MAAPTNNFELKATTYWNPERESKITSGKSYLLTPSKAPLLLRSLGLLNSDASMSSDNLRKFKQINHLLTIFLPPLNSLASRFPKIYLLDCASGKSYLTFALAFYLKHILKHPFHILGIDSSMALTQSAQKIAAENDFLEELSFKTQFLNVYLEEKSWEEEIFLKGTDESDSEKDLKQKKPRFHGIFSLHACDTATDNAMAIGLHQKSDLIAAVPCCQAELTRLIKGKEKPLKGSVEPIAQSSENLPNAAGLGVAWRHPEMRRETAALFTDLMRVQLLSGSGYEVTTTEFVSATHSAKNRLILAERRANYQDSVLSEYLELSQVVGGHNISLFGLLPSWVKERVAICQHSKNS